jgi:D-alanyl-D-alanine carboxypeptidase
MTLALVCVGCVPASDVVAPPSTPSITETGISTTPTGTSTTSPTTPTLDGVPVPPMLASAVVSQIAADLDALLATVPYTHGVYIVDAENGQMVYASNEDVPYKPASNTKLFTTGVAMDLLGPDHRFEVTALSSALPNILGVVDDLDVASGHDFTWSPFFYEDETFAADRLADQLFEAGVRQIDGTLTLHGEAVVDGYQFAYYDWDWHRDQALDVVATALVERGIAINGPLATDAGFSPAGVALATRWSPPLSASTHPLNVYSHNEFADALSRHNGLELWTGSTYADGEAAILDWLAGLGVAAGAVSFFDGSGLSHDNRVPARAVVDMQLAMWDRPAGEAWRRTFSVAGVIGTLAGRMTGSDTTGRFFGKSGTLNGVIATSGYLVNRYDGHTYVVSILMNDVSDSTTARALQDQVIERMAEDHREGGDRPSAPVLQSVLGGDSVDLAWLPSTGADGYTVWLTTDGVWRRTEARYVEETRVVLTGLELEHRYEIRVTADGPGGISDPSDVYTTRTSLSDSDILIVDGHDRYDTAWENPMGVGHRFAADTGGALAGRSHDTVSNESVISGQIALEDYRAVLWVLGEESVFDLTFDVTERALVDAYLAGGGNLMVSGAEIGWDLDFLGDADMQAFYEASLHAAYVEDDAGTFSAIPVHGGLFSGLGELGFLVPQTMQVDYPDVLSPQSGAVSELLYVGGTGGTAAISYSGVHRVVYLGFPFEAIDNGLQRESMLAAILGFFGL